MKLLETNTVQKYHFMLLRTYEKTANFLGYPSGKYYCLKIDNYTIEGLFNFYKPFYFTKRSSTRTYRTRKANCKVIV